MFVVEVIENGTGKWLAGDGSRNRTEALAMKASLQAEYPNANVIMEYISQTVGGSCYYEGNERKTMTNKNCFLCQDLDGGNAVPAVDYSPYGYPACQSHYNSDFSEFVSDYSQSVGGYC